MSETPPAAKRNPVLRFLAGIGWMALGHVCLFVFVPPAVIFIGVTQALYVVPLLIWAGIRKDGLFASGIVVAAAITFLLNAACWRALSKI